MRFEDFEGDQGRGFSKNTAHRTATPAVKVALMMSVPGMIITYLILIGYERPRCRRVVLIIEAPSTVPRERARGGRSSIYSVT
jgi:hypothetical protein